MQKHNSPKDALKNPSSENKLFFDALPWGKGMRFRSVDMESPKTA